MNARALLLVAPLGVLAGLALVPRSVARPATAAGAASVRAVAAGGTAGLVEPGDASPPLARGVALGSGVETAPERAPARTAGAEPAARTTDVAPPAPPVQRRFAEPREEEVDALEGASDDPRRLLELARATAHPLLRLEALARALEAGVELDALLPWGFEPDDPELHAFVGAALSDGGTASVAPELERWLTDPRASVRLAACDGLLGVHARAGTPDAGALAALAELARDATAGEQAVDVLVERERAAELEAWALRSDLGAGARAAVAESVGE
ncbi:MAG: hypothetical protein R3F62_21350 [Planctomycetota bacterium]